MSIATFLTFFCQVHIVWKSIKMSHLNFSISAFPPIFDLFKLTCLVTLFDRKHQFFKKSPKWTICGIFNELSSTQNVNVARFARNVEWDFFCDFQTSKERPLKAIKKICLSYIVQPILWNIFRFQYSCKSKRPFLDCGKKWPYRIYYDGGVRSGFLIFVVASFSLFFELLLAVARPWGY